MFRHAILLILAVVAFVSPAHADPASSAKSFLLQVYAPYLRPGVPTEWTRWLAPDLVALLKRSQRLTPPDEVGVPAGDPICDCQERDLHGLAITTEPGEANEAIGTASFTNVGRQTSIRFRLIATARAWRIADVTGADGVGLRRMLEDDIARRTAARPARVAQAAPAATATAQPFDPREIAWDETDLPSLLLLRFMPQKASSATGWTNWAMRQQMLERGQLPNLTSAAWPAFFVGPRSKSRSPLSALQMTPQEMQVFQDWNIQRSRAVPPVIVQSVPFALPPDASASDKIVRPLGLPAHAADDEQRVLGIGLTQIVYLGLAHPADEDAVELPDVVAASLPRAGVRLETRLRWGEPKRVDGTLLFPGAVQSLRLVAGTRLVWEHQFPADDPGK